MAKRSLSKVPGVALLLFAVTAASHGQESRRVEAGAATRRAKTGPRPVRAAPGVRVDIDVPYLGADRKEKLDVYMPANLAVGERTPCVIDIHGGGFMAGDKSDLREQRICNALAQRGYVAVSLNYYLPERRFLMSAPACRRSWSLTASRIFRFQFRSPSALSRCLTNQAPRATTLRFLMSGIAMTCSRALPQRPAARLQPAFHARPRSGLHRRIPPPRDLQEGC